MFEKSDCGIDLESLPSCEERKRKAALSKVNSHLKRVLTQEWQNFRLDDSNALKVSLEYEVAGAKITKHNNEEATEIKHFIKFEVVETSADGSEHFFYIRDRSKGFFWFFNFVMKLQFNPTVVGHSDSQKAVFLLDEPGCYLHATAQKKLCKKFVEIAAENAVVYCTHSHYLLDPEIVPIQAIQIAGRNGREEVCLTPISIYKTEVHENRTAFQPVLDSLHLTPFSLELMGERVVVVEGVTDFYVYSAILGDQFKFLPSVGASSVKYSLPFLLASGTKFCALWDNDDRGRAERKTAIRQFGVEFEAKFLLVPPFDGEEISTLESLFLKSDLDALAVALGFPEDADKKKVFVAFYYSARRSEMIEDFSTKAKARFEELRERLSQVFDI